MIKKFWRPVLALIVLSPLLAEVLSGATPVTQFFQPGIFLPYVVFLYGLQVLVLREVAVRKRYGLVALWCLGLVYGLYNEGLRSETLTYPQEAPIEVFGSYGLIAGFRVPFTVWILAWHALFSVVAPVLIIHRLFPAAAAKPWLPRKVTWALAIGSVASAAGYYLFLGDGRNAVHLAVIAGAALAFWLLACYMPEAQGGSGAALWGAACYMVMFVVPELLAEAAIPWWLFVVYLAAATVFFIRKLSLRFVFGAIIAQGVLAVLFGIITGNILWSVAGAVFAVIFVLALVRTRNEVSS